MSTPEAATAERVQEEQRTGQGEDTASAGAVTLRTIEPVMPWIVVAVVLQVLGSVLSAVQFLALAELAVKLVGGGAGWDASKGPLFLFLIALGSSITLGAVALLISHIADVDLQARLRLGLAAKLARLPLGRFDERSSGRVRQLIQNDVDSLHQLVAHTMVVLVAAVCTPLASLVVCFILDWRLGLVAVLPAVLYTVVYATLAPRSNAQVMDRIHEGLAGVSETIVEYVNGIAVLKIFGKVGQGSRRFTEESESFLREFADMIRPQMRAHSVAVVFLSAATAGVIEVAFGLWFVHAGWSRPSDLLVVTIIAMLLPASMQTVAASNRAFEQAVDAARRICEILDADELPISDAPARPDGYAVEFAAVRFAYDPGNPAVVGVSATIPAGGVTALVGPSGSGKSTVAALAARFRDPDSGAVRIGGVDVRDIDPEVMRRTVGTVFQDPQLLSISIADNIRLAVPDATDDQVCDAARAANIHDRIEQLPRGYDSVVGQDARLSGGEAQRVAIARTLLADTPVLVLDEATSATDPESEAAVQEGLNRLTAGRAVLVIAHRLTTVKDVDRILVMDGGRLVEQGTHDELLAEDGLYARMWKDMK